MVTSFITKNGTLTLIHPLQHAHTQAPLVVVRDDRDLEDAFIYFYSNFMLFEGKKEISAKIIQSVKVKSSRQICFNESVYKVDEVLSQ